MSLPSLLNHFLPWLNHYGSVAILVWFGLGIFALPVPEESLLLLLGFLMAKGKLADYSQFNSGLCGKLLWNHGQLWFRLGNRSLFKSKLG